MWQNRAIINQYKKALSYSNENLKFYMDESDITNVYVLIHNIAGDNDEYVGGQYLVHMKLPTNFPFSPPVFRFLTPQGRCEINVPVCIDIGHYHSENYRPTLGIYGFAMSLCNFLLSGQMDGINITNLSVAQKKQLASESKIYNITHHSDIISKF